MVESSILGEGFTIRNDVEYLAAAEDYNRVTREWEELWRKSSPSGNIDKFRDRIAVYCAKKFGGYKNTPPKLDPKKVIGLAKRLRVLEAI